MSRLQLNLTTASAFALNYKANQCKHENTFSHGGVPVIYLLLSPALFSSWKLKELCNGKP